MSSLVFIPIIATALALWLVAAWLDNTKGWQLINWMNGETANPFKPNQTKLAEQALQQKDQQITQLQERIQVLEKIVTEPAYELNKKINAL